MALLVLTPMERSHHHPIYNSNVKVLSWLSTEHDFQKWIHQFLS